MDNHTNNRESTDDKPVKNARLFHNPNAGHGEHTAEELVSLVEQAGFVCEYTSTKEKAWERVEGLKTDLIVLAGGDGTVRKVAPHILGKEIPIGLFPLGTANNISKTLGIAGDTETIAGNWSHGVLKAYDVGKIGGLNGDGFLYFLEGMGYGVFPRLMKRMRDREGHEDETPQENLRIALDMLHEIILSYKAKACTIQAEGITYSGKFLLVEIMNICSIGPNLNLDPTADPGDGELEVVLVPEEQREAFAAYVRNKIKGIEEPFLFNVFKAKKISVEWEGRLVHVDDENIPLKKSREVTIDLQAGMLHFLVPEEKGRRIGELVSAPEVPASDVPEDAND